MNLNNSIETRNTNPSNAVKDATSNAPKQSRPTSVSGAATVNTDAPIVIAIDHGYGNIKTPTFIFPACATLCDQEPVFGAEELLSYEGRRYSIGTGHKEFRQDKIMDEDYYILTLAAIGKELKHRRLTTAKVVIAAGLPLTWAAKQREQFKTYLSKNPHVDFSYLETTFHVDIAEVLVYYQGISAVATKINQFKGTNMLADIGNGTMNVLNINERKLIPESCFTEKYGTYQCVIAAREMLQREFSSIPTDAQIEKYLRSLHADIGEKYQEVIKASATRYVSVIFRKLREHDYDPALMRLWVTGGGACLVRNFGTFDKERVIILNDIQANARGYEKLALHELEGRRGNHAQ